MARPYHRILSSVVALAAAAVAGLASAQDYRPDFHPDQLKGPPAGAPNTVLVLGTAHLSGLPETFDLSLLAPLMDKLAAWAPTAIATEDLSGLQCDSLRRYPQRYAETIESYCSDPSAAGAALGLDVPAANAEAERLLADWPAAPTAAQRRHLAAVFLAAGEPGSALVQWLRLPTQERRAGDGLTDDLAARMERIRVRRNETDQISAPLAARLGLERLWSVDDHSADSPDSPDPAVKKAYADAVTGAWNNPYSRERRAESERLQAKLNEPGGVLALYRAYNEPRQSLLTYQSDFGAVLKEPSPQGFGRNYVGYWETRNLRMAANMRDVLGRYPGTRMLTIVGASHKPYYEAYLNMMHDVVLADPEAVLR